MTGRHEMQEGSPDYWRALHNRLVAEGRLPGPEMPPVDPFDALNVLEAAGYLEAMRQAVALADETDGFPRELADELEAERAEARAIFERKFFEVN